jgi:hypothetical protein
MSKLAIFTAPKPFTDPHINIIQRNAIRSWVEMGPEVEVFVIGEEAGLAEAARELGVVHLKEVQRNEHNTPLVSSMFDIARANSAAPLLACVNADMLLFPETLPISLGVLEKQSEFVLLGQRHDLDQRTPLDFSARWPEHLRADVAARGRLHPMGGSDYFIFPRHLFTSIPNFAIGRAGWDNWMIYHAVTQPWPAINATPDLMVVHQNHDYAHLSGERSHQRHPETYENADLGGGMRNMYMLLDVNYKLQHGKVKPAGFSISRLLRSIERWLQPDEFVGRGLRWRALRVTRKLRRKLSGVEAD